MNDQHNTTEEFKVSGEELLAKVKALAKEGNIRRLIIKSKEGKTLIEIPLTAGVVGGAALLILAPVLAAVGAIAALVTECTVVVVRDEN
jgi:hypothetical protein